MQRLFILFLMLYQLLMLPVSAAAGSVNKIDFSPAEQQWLNAHTEVTLALDGYFPPYSFLNDSGELEGFAVDVFSLVAERTGLNFNTFSQHKWEALYQSAQNKQVDVVATMVDKPIRHEWFNFTKPYIYKSLVVIKKGGNNAINTAPDLAGKTVALVKDYQYIPKILNDYPTIKPIYVDTILDSLNAVAIGEADAAISFLGAAHFYRNKYVLSNLDYAFIYDKNTSNESIAVRQDWPELSAILDKALASISEQEMLELLNKWLPSDYTEGMKHIDFTDAELAWLKQKRTIRLGIDPEFAPFEYIEDKQYKGISSDYVKLLNERLNINMELVADLSWKQVMEKSRQGDIDVLASVGMTDERKQFLNYTPAYLKFHRVIVTRDDMPFISGLSDIRNKPIAVQANSSHHGYIREHTQITPVTFQTQQDSLLALSGGKVDAFVGNVASVSYWIRKLNLSNLKIAAPVSTDIQSLHFAVRKDWPELTSILQKGLATISDKHRKEISEKWLLIESDPRVDYQLIWQIVIAFSVLLATIVLWNRSLRKRLELHSSQLAHSFSHDQLTKLPNRILIADRLKQLITEASDNNMKVALFSIDIDDFKKINDAFGHETGDLLIQEFASIIKTTLPENNNVGRLGADQFLIIHSHFKDVADLAIMAKKILAPLHGRFNIASHDVTLTTSVGIAIFPDDGNTAASLLRHADTATHHAKNHMPGSFAFYTEKLNQEVARKLEIEQHLISALKRNEFDIYFQPKIDVQTQNIVSFEALLRWSNNELGMVSPDEFIPITEKNGLIIDIGDFVINQAVSSLAYLQERYDMTFSMAINLSPVQFSSINLVQKIESVINKNGIAAGSLEFEITEGALLSEHIDVQRKLIELESLGISLAMDDFGTGYSSLSYLRKYKFDTLKIDREFIAELAIKESNRQLVTATIAMAHGLGMQVVAEGVETQEQCDILSEHNCDLLQGWLFSKALSIDQLTELLDQDYEVKT